MDGAISGKPGMKKIGNLTKYYEVSVFFLIITDLGKVSIESFAGLADARVCVRLCLPACPVAPGDGTGVSLEDRTGVCRANVASGWQIFISRGDEMPHHDCLS